MHIRKMSSINNNNNTLPLPHPLKSGELLVCIKGMVTKSWKPRRCFLYPPWEGKPAFIQMEDIASDKKTKAIKSFSLKGLRKVITKPHASNVQLEVVTKKESITFSSNDASNLRDWESYLMSVLSSLSDGSVDGSQDGSDHHGDDTHSVDVDIDENLIYESSAPVRSFQVTIDQTQDSNRLCLSGEYCLFVNAFDFSLTELKSNRLVCQWLYKHIRQYGQVKNIFSFEVSTQAGTMGGYYSFLSEEAKVIKEAGREKMAKMKEDAKVLHDMMIQKTDSQKQSAHSEAKAGIISSLSRVDHEVEGKKDKQSRSSYESESNKEANKKEKHDKKAEKAKLKEEKIKGIKSKGKKGGYDLKLKLDKQDSKEVSPDIKLGMQVLPTFNDKTTPQLKPISTGESSKLKPPTTPIAAIMPHKRLSGTVSDPPTSPKPQELYALPQGKGLEHIPFPKKKPQKPDPTKPRKVEPVYDEIEDPCAMSRRPTAEESAYEDIDAGSATAKVKPILYSDVGFREAAWKIQGMAKERHIEHYAKPEVIASSSERKPVTKSKPVVAKPVVSKPLVAKPVVSNTAEFNDDDYDHLNIQSTKFPNATRKPHAETDNIYSETFNNWDKSNSASKPAVNSSKAHQGYEEAVLKPK